MMDVLFRTITEAGGLMVRLYDAVGGIGTVLGVIVCCIFLMRFSQMVIGGRSGSDSAEKGKEE